MDNKKILILLLGVFLISSVSALDILVTPLDVSGNLQSNLPFNYQFNFTTDNSCANIVGSYTTTITTNKNGIGHVYIETSAMSEIPLYLCEYRGGSLRKVHNITDTFTRNVYAYNAKINSTLNISNSIKLDGNSGNITTNSWFNGKYNWTTISDWLSFNGNFLSYNETKFNSSSLLVCSIYNETNIINIINTTAGIQYLLNGTGIYSAKNPFNQSLNTTDAVLFENITIRNIFNNSQNEIVINPSVNFSNGYINFNGEQIFGSVIVGNISNTSGVLYLFPRDNVDIGGRMIIRSPADYSDWNIDVYQGRLRLFNNTNKVIQFTDSFIYYPDNYNLQLGQNGKIYLNGSTGIISPDSVGTTLTTSGFENYVHYSDSPTSTGKPLFQIYNYFNSTSDYPSINLGKSRGMFSAPFGVTVGTQGGTFGNIFRDTNSWTTKASWEIYGIVDGTPTTTSVPSSLIFAAGNGSSLTNTPERMRITSNGSVGIGTTTPLYPLTIVGNDTASGLGISLWVDGNISANDYITRTKIYENKNDKKVFDWIKENKEYKTLDNKINHSAFYGYLNYTGTDYSKPDIKTEIREECDTIDILDKDGKVIGTKEGNCKNVTISKTYYPETKIEEGISFGSQVALHEQALYIIKNCTIQSKKWEDFQICIMNY